MKSLGSGVKLLDPIETMASITKPRKHITVPILKSENMRNISVMTAIDNLIIPSRHSEKRPGFNKGFLGFLENAVIAPQLRRKESQTLSRCEIDGVWLCLSCLCLSCLCLSCLLVYEYALFMPVKYYGGREVCKKKNTHMKTQ